MQKFLKDYRALLRSVPADVLTLFTLSVVLMNLLANKEIYTGIPWLALDCGLLLSWLSFLCMDMLTKRFGPKASMKLSMFAVGVNLLACGVFYLVSKVPGNWGASYTYESGATNAALNETIGGTWYVLLGSMVAFLVSATVNAITNACIGKLCKTDTFKSFAARTWVSTLIAQFVDNLVFSLVVSHVFFGWTLVQCLTCSATGCIVELLCEIVFSPLGYKVCRKWQAEGVGNEYLEEGKC